MNLLENSCPLSVEEIISTNGGQSSYLQEHNDWPGNREREVYRSEASLLTFGCPGQQQRQAAKPDPRLGWTARFAGPLRGPHARESSLIPVPFECPDDTTPSRRKATPLQGRPLAVPARYGRSSLLRIVPSLCLDCGGIDRRTAHFADRSPAFRPGL
jgi:hypothetical protein